MFYKGNHNSQLSTLNFQLSIVLFRREVGYHFSVHAIRS